MSTSRLVLRFMAIGAAFAAGWLVYMIAMMMTVYDGAPSLIFQPIVAALFSGFVVGLSLFVGLLLRVPPLARAWNASWLVAASIAAASVFILVFGYSLGLTDVGVNPETHQEVTMLHPAAGLGGSFALVFSLANWPIRRRDAQNEPPRMRGGDGSVHDPNFR
jgi:hypothetical protein